MLNIKFAINNNEYRLKSSSYDFILYEVGTVQTGDNKGNESTKPVGFFSDVFGALNYIPNHHLVKTDCTNFLELENELKECISAIKQLSKQCVAECYIRPEDLQSKKTKKSKKEIEEDGYYER